VSGLRNAIITREQAARFAPIVNFHVHERFFPCSIDWLLQRATLRSKDDHGFTLSHPRQADLAVHCENRYYLDIEEAAHHGQPLVDSHVAAPMYVAAQEWDDCIEITYVMLYAYQGGQTCLGLKPGHHFHAVVDDYGHHQGDLEWVSVLVSKDYEHMLGVGYAVHGDVTYYRPGDCLTEGDHPRARAALNGHASLNGKHKNAEDWSISFEVPLVVAVTDVITEAGAVWAPHRSPGEMLRIIGLDEGRPLSDQPWAAFRGRLGIHQENDFSRATRLNGEPLPEDEEGYAKLVIGLAKATRMLPESMRDGDGPEGPGARDFVQGLRRHGNRLAQLKALVQPAADAAGH
jgi:hypothetical protein